MNSNSHPLQQIILLSQQGGSGNAGYLIFHPERRHLLPTVQKLYWNRLENITRFSAVIVKNFLFILGGYNTQKRKIQRTVIRYDLETSTWYYCNKMLKPRADFCAIVNDGRIYCAGGISTGNLIIADCESYEPFSNTWYEENPLPLPCSQYAAIQLSIGPVIIGGLIRTPNGSKKCSNYFWYFNKQKSKSPYLDYDMQWSNLECARFPSLRGVRCHCLTFDSIKKRLYLVGGTNDLPAPDGVDSNHNLKGLYYFDMAELESVMNDLKPKENSNVNKQSNRLWRKRSVIQCQRMGASVCVFGNKLMVIGGVLVPSQQPESAAQMVNRSSPSLTNSDRDSNDDEADDNIDTNFEVDTSKVKESIAQKAIWKSLKSINNSATKSMKLAEKQFNSCIINPIDNANIRIDIQFGTNSTKPQILDVGNQLEDNLPSIDTEHIDKYVRRSLTNDAIGTNEISKLSEIDKDVKLSANNGNLRPLSGEEILQSSEINSEKQHVSNVGYYDTYRKVWFPMFGLDDELLDTRSIVCLPLELKHHNRDMRQDRFNWLVQWALW